MAIDTVIGECCCTVQPGFSCCPGYRPASLFVDVAGLVDGYLNCAAGTTTSYAHMNGTYELIYYPGTFPAGDYYVYESFSVDYPANLWSITVACDGSNWYILFGTFTSGGFLADGWSRFINVNFCDPIVMSFAAPWQPAVCIDPAKGEIYNGSTAELYE